MRKWEVIRIPCPFLVPPHDKYCVCICPENYWFMFINSEPPQFRKAREIAVSIESHEAHFLKRTSYIDTTKLQTDLPPECVTEALGDSHRNYGPLAPFLRERIMAVVSSHEAMEPKHRAKLLEG